MNLRKSIAVKKGIFLLSTIILLIVGWSAGWYFVAGKIETAISDTKTKLADKGRDIECTNQEVNGFPFRISLNCDEVRYADDVTGVVFEAGELRTAAQTYQPNKAIVELKSPASLTLPNGDRFNTSWKSMRSSLKAGLSGPENLSLQGKQVVLIPAKRAKHTMRITDMQLHGRQSGDNDVNLAVVVKEAKSQNGLWPTFNLDTTLLLEDTYKDIVNRTSILRVAKRKGLKGQIENFQYAPIDGGMLEVSGPAEVSKEGLLFGKFNVTVRELPKLINALSKSFPEERQKFADASKAVALLAQKTGKNEIFLPITLRNGKISIGIIPLGKLSPLF